MRFFTKKKQSEQQPVKKKPIYKELKTIPDNNNNNNPFGSETSLSQEKKTFDEIRKKVEETKDIATKNIENLENRGENLDNLDKKAEKIKKSSRQFKRNTKEVNKKLKNKYLRCKIFLYTIFSCSAFLFFYIFFGVKEQNTISKILECVGGSISTLCVVYLAVNDCRDVIDFDLCLEKISCCNKDNKQEECLPNIV